MRPAIAITALSFAALARAQQTPTIRVPVRLVSLPTLVFSSENRLLPNLQPADFRVMDNGRLQSITVDPSSAPISVAVVIQVSQDVRAYVPFIAKAGSVLDALLIGESGEAAIITYSNEVTIVKPFNAVDVHAALRTISAYGTAARMIDAGVRATRLLAERPSSRARILLFIGQPIDSGSESSFASLKESAEKDNIAVYALTLPMLGKTFVSDTFSLKGPTFEERGGFRAGVDLGKLVSVLNGSAKVEKGADPFSILIVGTGGIQLHFRTQRQLEDAIAAVGVELRSAYVLSYSPSSHEAGYHSVKIEVNVPGAKVYSRPGYWYAAE